MILYEISFHNKKNKKTIEKKYVKSICISWPIMIYIHGLATRNSSSDGDNVSSLLSMGAIIHHTRH